MITPSIATALLECFAIIDQNINIFSMYIFQCQVTNICMDILFREMYHLRQSVPFILHAVSDTFPIAVVLQYMLAYNTCVLL